MKVGFTDSTSGVKQVYKEVTEIAIDDMLRMDIFDATGIIAQPVWDSVNAEWNIGGTGYDHFHAGG
jgi:hypothetical protein